ncbi:hypothetical protein [Priestia megaterium]|nr:hypothetical protein [Priestia megaterium]
MPKNKEGDYYVSFDIGEKSSQSASKGLKKSTFILYTVFVAKKTLRKRI